MTSDRRHSDTIVTALPVVDALEGDDGAVLLVAHGAGHRVVRLSLLGALVREYAGTGRPLGELAAAVTSVLGPPPTGDPVELLQVVVGELQREGVVSVVRDDAESLATGAGRPAGSKPAPES